MTGITEIIPDLDGSYKDKIGHDFDEFFYMMNEGGKFVTRTKPFGKVNAKTRWLKVDKIEDATFEKIWSLRKMIYVKLVLFFSVVGILVVYVYPIRKVRDLLRFELCFILLLTILGFYLL